MRIKDNQNTLQAQNPLTQKNTIKRDENERNQTNEEDNLKRIDESIKLENGLTKEINLSNELQKPFDKLNTSQTQLREGDAVKNKKKYSEKCPIYYGIKSYIHNFYTPPDMDVLNSGEFMLGEDPRYLSDPRRKRSCLIRVGLFLGVNLILIGSIATLVGFLTPPHKTIVGQFQGYAVLDLWAVNFNNHLELCQLTGLATLFCGSAIVISCLLLASCHRKHSVSAPSYYVMGATLLPQSFVGAPYKMALSNM